MCTMGNGHYLGILNDFDLATIMDPGDRNPKRKGWERTGSIGFMSLDLLKHPDGEQMRWYRHDLESFLWSLLWEMMDVPPVSWLEDDFDGVRAKKNLLCADISRHMSNIRSEWAFAKEFVVNWVLSLYEASVARTKKENSNLSRRDIRKPVEISVIEFNNIEDEQKKDPEHIRPIAESAKVLARFVDIPALRETSWIDVVLEGLIK